jgi:phytanoyl-CoA hydroxylase
MDQAPTGRILVLKVFQFSLLNIYLFYIRTNGFRKAISCHYAASECEYIEVEGTLQENYKREVEEIAAKKAQSKIDLKDIWRFKSRLVCGESINL